jgi:hypothetical protein
MNEILLRINEIKKESSERDTLIIEEIQNLLEDSEKNFKKIVEMNNKYFLELNIVPNENNEINLFGFKIKLLQADPNIPIKLNNASIARSPRDVSSGEELKEIKALTRLVYYDLHKVLDLFEKINNFGKKKYIGIVMVRNKLLEHSSEKDSNILFDSFVTSITDGPQIKGMRLNNQLNHFDKGLFFNYSEFITYLKQKLKN